MLKQTPSQTIGPFFHPGLLHNPQHSLVDEQTQGQRIRLLGTVYDGAEQPILDAMLEIWQADANGVFNHPADSNCARADPHFRGFGRCGTTDSGSFEFVTVKPGPFNTQDGKPQAPFINVRIFMRGLLIHTYTRIYFSDESANTSDPVLSAIEPDRRATLIAQRQEYPGLPNYRFDIHMQGDNETVFFEP